KPRALQRRHATRSSIPCWSHFCKGSCFMALGPENQSGLASGTQRPPAVIVQQSGGSYSRLKFWLLMVILITSLLVNVGLYSAYKDYFAGAEGPTERFHSGDQTATDKLALIRISGTIMPPFTDRVLKMIKGAKEDKHVKGVLLAVDSP